MSDASTLANIRNFREVDEHLATCGQPSEAQLAIIAAQGFSTVINLALHNDPRYSLPNEAMSVQALGMEYVHIPVQFANPTEADLLAFMSAMDEHQNQKLLVHCAANYRATAFLGLYRVIKLQWPREKSFELMHEAVWSAFIETMLEKMA
jgi:uncharacterized protein (TIGR01244 family)